MALPEDASRLYSPTHTMALTGGLVAGGLGGVEGAALVLVLLADETHLVPSAAGVGRACPLYSRKTAAAAATAAATAVVVFATAAAPTVLLGGAAVSAAAPTAASSVQLAARIAETPCEDMNCADVEAEARAALAGVPNVTIQSIVGEEAKAAGLGGIYNVSSAAVPGAECAGSLLQLRRWWWRA